MSHALLAHVVHSGPLMQADAIVVLAGEDAEPRVACALELFAQRAAPTVVITGGLNRPPRIHDAKFIRAKLVGSGISPTRMIVDTEAMHTQAQAANVAKLCAEKGWKRLLVVASPYHIYRAFLTFVQALKDAKLDETVRVVMVPASQSRWFVKPEGCDLTRWELLPGELAKIDEYGAKGHVASAEDAAEYVRFWELHQDAA